MPERLGDAVLELRTDDRALTAGIGRARGAAEALSRRFDAIGRRVQRLGTIMSAAFTAPAIALGTLTAKAFDQQIQAERRLGASIRAAGEDAEAQLEIFKEYAATLQSITTTGDETTLANVQMARSMGLNARQAASAAKNAIALSAAFGINERAAIRYTAALEQGDTTMLNRYIPTLRNIEDQNERAAEAQRILAGAFDVATESAVTGLGPLRQLRNDVGDLAEQFGEVVLEFINPFIERLRALVRRLQALSPEARRTALAIAALAAAIGPGLIALGLLVRGLGVALVGLVAFGRGTRVLVRAVLAEMALMAAAFASPVGAAVAAAAAILGAWLLFRRTIVATAKAIIDGLEFWLVKQFRNNVERPFLEALNELIAALPAFVRDALDIGPVEVPPELLGSPGEVFAEGFAEARRAAQRDIAAIEASFEAMVDRVKSVLPDGVADLFFGDFEGLNRDIDAANDKLAGLLGQLPDGGGAPPVATAGAAGGAAGAAGAVDTVTGSVRDLAAEAERGTAVTSRAFDSLGSSLEFGIDRLTDDLLRGEASWRSFARVAIDAVQDMLRAVARGLGGDTGAGIGALAVQGIGALAGAFFGGGTPGTLTAAQRAAFPSGGFAAGGRPPVGRASIVGEFGPERFVPDSAGTITPNNPLRGLGRTQGDTVFIDATGADQAAIGRLERVVRELNGSIERRAVGAVVQQRRRNPRLFGARGVG